jgi:hypothetical protein
MLDPEETIVIAPTGRVSNNILGSTYHLFFAIYPGQSRRCGLKGKLSKRYHSIFYYITNTIFLFRHISQSWRVAGKKYIILDEISMLDPRDLYCINHRCQQAIGLLDEPFGCMNFLIFGDFKQLEPALEG